MKRKLHIALAMAMALVSGCRHSDHYDTTGASDCLNVSVREIAGANVDTKSQTVPTDTLWLNDSLYVEAVADHWAAQYTPTSRATPITSSKQITTMSIIMFNTGAAQWTESSTQEVTDGKSPMRAYIANGGYSITKPYQWLEGDLKYRTLIAISPYHLTASSGLVLNAAGQTLDVTVPGDVAKQQDLCVSKIENNKNVQNVVGSNNNLQKFAMAHVMTAIGFEAAGYDLKLTGVKLIGINSKATLTLHNRTWSTPITPINVEAKINADQWLDSEHIQSADPWRNITPNDGYMMLLPQTHDDNAKLEFTFDGRGGQPAGTYTMQLNQIKVAGASSSEWKPGMKITYRLRLKTRPAVRNDQVLISNYTAGSTTPALNIMASDDDELTLSWTSNWLGAYRGPATTITSPESNGYFPPFNTGVNNWTNLKFFARSANNSTIIDRVATVTVTGKKSGQRTFTVTHPKQTFEISSTNLSVSWHPQSAGVTYVSPTKAEVTGLPSWCTATVTSNSINFNFAMLFDLDTRTATATVRCGSVTKTINLTQKSSGTGLYSMLNVRNREVFVALSDESGLYNWEAAKSRCFSKGGEWRLALDHEMTIIYNNVNPRHASYNFSRANYWSADYYTYREPYFVDMNVGVKVSGAPGSNYHVRCVRGRE